MTIEDFNGFCNMAYEALSEPKMQWTYIAAMRFVFQAVTTIGYGFITPQTPEGQLLCIFVSLFGIPITLLAFQAIGELITRWVNRVVEKFERKILKRMEPRGIQKKSAFLLVLATFVLILVNGSVMTILFDWSFIESVYFWFVTLTTIGFGDYTPVKSQRIRKLNINISQNYEEEKDVARKLTLTIVSSIFYTFYLILCLCIVSSLLNSIVSYIEECKFRTPCSGCVPRTTRDQPENEVNISKEKCFKELSFSNQNNLGFQMEGDKTAMSVVDLELKE
ncbi:potassium channel subfamily K member 3-like [Montipora capricornis]|uniref:potassium channel subfamily K member 3-like n=1 Tax=Montipora capricornis TaxID=246305 RepID=UPI0035F17B2C